ncbi:NAD(P)/FAD-dependent oxidoreductase [Methylocystis sp. Sn-Cys]|uniref:dihydrolipoyl dehydrogenase family protein n=1 Tax=Methylocystis sp. Sn-Cys TaxID=1701263 RepID=UPI0019218BC5|nr:FAD-dependent oxidoreductase [Methylocystis sp. Sn-Cys]MBL1255628.1 FAD-dependent oxidoreductase [Methylocystis sp. Sn-Cys]
MSETINCDLCVIGAGSAGLSVAAGAAQMGASTVLIEANRMGGDCLNSGCVPSKSLLAAAKAAKNCGDATRFGVDGGAPRADFAAVHAYVRGVIASIAPHDSVERFTDLGCTVIKGRARFIDDRTVEADGKLIRARRFVIATGSRVAIPDIPGLDDVPFLTSDTIFDNAVLPEHLIVIGGGPIGCELAQAYRRLGAKTTLVEMARILPREDKDAVDVVRQSLLADGVVILEGVRLSRIEKDRDGVAVFLQDREETRIAGSHLLVATGRRPNVETLGLEAAEVRYCAKGVDIDARLRTTNKRIYVAGDAAGGPQFTHMASYHAGIVIRNALFRWPARNRPAAFPRVIYTGPELAQVGLSESEGRERYGDAVRILRADFKDNDRAQTEGLTRGFLKVVATKRGHILGATIVGHDAGELITPWTLAISQRLEISALANLITPYPTLSEISKRAAGSYYTPALFSPRTRRLVRFLRIFG